MLQSNEPAAFGESYDLSQTGIEIFHHKGLIRKVYSKEKLGTHPQKYNFCLEKMWRTGGKGIFPGVHKRK